MTTLTEEVLTEFERTKDYFADDFGQNTLLENGELSNKFLAYYLGQIHLSEEVKKTATQELGITEEYLKNYSRKARMIALSGFRGMEELSETEKAALADIPNVTIENWKQEQF